MYLTITINLIYKDLILNLYSSFLWYQQSTVVILCDNNLTTTTTLQQMFWVRETGNNTHRTSCCINDTAGLNYYTFVVISCTISQQQANSWERLDGIVQSIISTTELQHVSFSHWEINFNRRCIADSRNWLCRRCTYQSTLLIRKTTYITRCRTLHITETEVILSRGKHCLRLTNSSMSLYYSCFSGSYTTLCLANSSLGCLVSILSCFHLIITNHLIIIKVLAITISQTWCRSLRIGWIQTCISLNNTSLSTCNTTLRWRNLRLCLSHRSLISRVIYHEEHLSCTNILTFMYIKFCDKTTNFWTYLNILHTLNGCWKCRLQLCIGCTNCNYWILIACWKALFSSTTTGK